MTRTDSMRPMKTCLTLGLSAALAMAALTLPSEALAADPGDSSTEAPVIVIAPPAPAPDPAPVQPPPAPTYDAAGVVPPPPPALDTRRLALRHQRNSGLGMTISGFTIFGTSYLVSALIGTISLDLAADEGGSGTYGRRMLIPVGGPFAAIPRTGSATGSLFTAMLGVVQLGGLALGTAGAIRLGRANRELRLSANSGGLQLEF